MTRLRGALGRVLVVGLCATGLACGGHRTTERPQRAGRNLITREQMVRANYVNAYDAVAALRSNWLRARGPDSFQTPSQVWVYLDGNRMGDVETLRRIQPSLITSIRFFDGTTATARWGVGHSAGVISIDTWPQQPQLRRPGDSL